ncbi:hypothetical protein H2203_000611 [Taxawa tesnikishii (nom. ined.)]|nr:hypothetical protein H2203_000611 [Dothideales sp. JES 119]
MPRSSKIVVEKLTKNVNEGHLREIFGTYGSIADLDMPMNRQFMTNRGTAYILYSTPLPPNLPLHICMRRSWMARKSTRPPPNRFGEPHRYREPPRLRQGPAEAGTGHLHADALLRHGVTVRVPVTEEDTMIQTVTVPGKGATALRGAQTGAGVGVVATHGLGVLRGVHREGEITARREAAAGEEEVLATVAMAVAVGAGVTVGID